jgi:long-chain acyl-CoA synthetase
VHGEGRHFVSALGDPRPRGRTTWAAGTPHADLPYEQIVALPEMRAEVAAAIKQLNDGLARWETIKKFAILPHDFSVDTGEMTPSLKVKRRVVEANHREVLDALYDEEPARA